MKEFELENTRQVNVPDTSRIRELELWFRTEYVQRILAVQRNTYLGIKGDESRFEVEKEAYEKENELRHLLGKEPLPELKIRNMF